jgi:hypothetical protein
MNDSVAVQIVKVPAFGSGTVRQSGIVRILQVELANDAFQIVTDTMLEQASSTVRARTGYIHNPSSLAVRLAD